MNGKAFIARSIVNEDLSFMIFLILIHSRANNHTSGQFVKNPDDLAAGMYKVVVKTSSLSNNADVFVSMQ